MALQTTDDTDDDTVSWNYERLRQQQKIRWKLNPNSVSDLTLYIRYKYTHTRLTALCPGLPRWAGTRKVKTNLGFTEARDSEWQWNQLGHMQLCISLQTDNHTSTPGFTPLRSYRPDALPAAQSTVSKHWRHVYVTNSRIIIGRIACTQCIDVAYCYRWSVCLLVTTMS